MNGVALSARDLWMSIPAAGRSFSKKERSQGGFLFSAERSCTLALLELFGLMTVGREDPDEGQSWRVTEVLHSPSSGSIFSNCTLNRQSAPKSYRNSID